MLPFVITCMVSSLRASLVNMNLSRPRGTGIYGKVCGGGGGYFGQHFFVPFNPTPIMRHSTYEYNGEVSGI